MKCSFYKSRISLTAVLRLALVAGLALLGVGAQAQIQGPYPPNPTAGVAPTPYSWPTYHAGGAVPLPLDSTQTLSFLPPNPLATQQQGLPTGVATNGTNKYITEISSFVLGNYNPVLPPSVFGAGGNPGFPNHFRDDNFIGGILSWSAPFTFLQATTTGTGAALAGVVLADDYDTTAFTYPTTAGFPANWTVQSTFTGGWSLQANTSADVSGNPANTTPGYQSILAVTAKTPLQSGLATAKYTFDAPTGSTGGYSVDFHLPPPVQNEKRINNAHYVITLEHPAGATPVTLFDGRVDQTSTTQPRQHIAGPFGITAGDRVIVTLDNSSDPNQQTLPDPNNNVYVLADSVSLVEGLDSGTGATVQSSPTAISVDDFPEIADALYFGFQNTGRQTLTDPVTGLPVAGAPTGVATGQKFDPNPYGNQTIGTTNPDNTHRIRQLVYFGRTETIVLTDNQGNLKDGNGNPTTVPVSETVGAVYCVDGITGSVVWRFQAPDVLDNSTPPNVLKHSAGISSAPAVARLNVLTAPGATPTYSTKLCVIAADDNGLIYCLDAIGNRNGTSNLGINEDGTGTTSPVVPVYNQPIYNPTATLNTGAGQDLGGTANHAHVGNTQAYWIYRPDPNASLNTNAGQSAPHVTNPANDLPVPQAFGLASATIYVDPTVTTSSTTLAPASPIVSDPVAVNSNAAIYIGNSNGTLYALDAQGVVPSDTPALYNRSLNVGIKSAGFTILAGEPTVTPIWWLPINHGQTNNPDATGNVSITSTPAILQTNPDYTAQTTKLQIPARPVASSAYTIYVTTANDDDNVGRLYAVSNTGPVGGVALGHLNYNANASAVWAFPDLKHNPLGSITGSPVVFTNPDDRTTNIYMAANVGIEYKGQGLDAPAIAGRIWAVHSNLTGTGAGQAIWAYPDTFDPNANPSNVDPTVTLGGTTITSPATQLPQPLGSFENATPAIGVVQFPTNIVYGTGTPQTPYTHMDNASVTATAPNQRTSQNVLGQKVPMLYVGSRDAAQDSIGSTFYALDLDGNTTAQRDIFDYTGNPITPAPLGTVFTTGGFLSSPLLITNPTETGSTNTSGPGNGGAVFIAGSDNNLYEVGATPTSGDANSTEPQLLPLFLRLPGFGSLSSPSAAAYSTADLVVTSSGGKLPPTARVVTEWVYGGDEIAGVARGITPANRSDSGGTINYGTGGPPVDFNAPPIILPYHAHVYVFDNIPPHDATSTDMSNANKIGAAIATFEWGTNAYLRVSNVVPPNPTDSPTRWVAAPGVNLSNLKDGDIFFSNVNNSPVNINISDVDPRTGKPTDNNTYRSDASTGTSVFDTATSISPPETNGNGFYPESGLGELDGNTASGGASTNGDMLIGATGKPWIGAASYSINPIINTKPNTPGARRRVIQATQKNIRVYQYVITGGVPQPPKIVSGNTSIDVFTDSSQQTTLRNPTGTSNPPGPVQYQTTSPQQQPTFGVLNPIAVRGGGYPIQVSGAAPQAEAIGPQMPALNGSASLLGPFGGVHATLTQDDVQALTNGNSIFVDPNVVPKSGTISSNTGRRVHVDVITATSPIAHGTAGDNSDPKSTTFAPASSNQTTLYGTASTATFGAYALTIADRSALGVPPPTGAAQTLSNLKIGASAAQWNDNVGTGPLAVVNPLPWEDTASIIKGSNGSLDYPDMPGSTIRQTLYSTRYGAQNISDTAIATPDPASGSAAALASRTVYPNPVQVQVRVPKYQPANLQIYYQSPKQPPTSASPAGPSALNQNVDAFPMGYVARKIVFVDSGVGSPRNKAHRDILVYTGVPVDMTTTIVNQTTDLGKLPQSFGIQTDRYAGLDPLASATLGYGFMPYNPAYSNYFKPLTVLNQGNVNLLNVQFDQKQVSYIAGSGPSNSYAVLPLVSDALDPLSLLPSYD